MSQVVTALVYIISVIVFKEYINVDSILRLEFLRKVGVIVLVAWGPIFLMRAIRRKMDPTEGEKIMKDVKGIWFVWEDNDKLRIKIIFNEKKVRIKMHIK